MKEVFMNRIKESSEKLQNRLITDAHTDFVERYARLDLNPTEAAQLADKYVNLFMAQEVQFNLTKNLLNDK